MTKLLEWVAGLTTFLAVWLALITNKVEMCINKQYPTLVFFSPLIFLALFGLYALTVVLYRVFTFNNCEKAAEELQNEIIQAKEDLTKLGYKFVK